MRGMPFIHLEDVEPGMGLKAFGKAVSGLAQYDPMALADHVSGR